MNCWHKNVHVLLRLLSVATIVALPVLLDVSAHATLLCQDCHGTRAPADIRPLDDGYQRNPYTGGFIGNHRTHIPAQATAASCEPCHRAARPMTSTPQRPHHDQGRPEPSLLRTVYGPTPRHSFPQTSLPQPSPAATSTATSSGRSHSPGGAPLLPTTRPQTVPPATRRRRQTAPTAKSTATTSAPGSTAARTAMPTTDRTAIRTSMRSMRANAASSSASPACPPDNGTTAAT